MLTYKLNFKLTWIWGAWNISWMAASTSAIPTSDFPRKQRFIQLNYWEEQTNASSHDVRSYFKATSEARFHLTLDA